MKPEELWVRRPWLPVLESTDADVRDYVWWHVLSPVRHVNFHVNVALAGQVIEEICRNDIPDMQK